jgi:hypothetical protein
MIPEPLEGTMRRIIVVAALLALVTAACQIETNLTADIKADGSGTITVELGYDQEAASFIEQASGSQDPLAGQPITNLPNAQVRQEDRGNMHFYIVSSEVDNVATALNDLAQQEQGSAMQNLQVTVAPDSITVTGNAGGQDALSGGGEGIPVDQISQYVRANVKITLPGKILQNNADSRDGNTLTWALPLTGAGIDIQASSNPSLAAGGGGFPLWAIIVIAAAVVLGGAALIAKGRRGRGAAVPPPPPPPEPETPTV